MKRMLAFALALLLTLMFSGCRKYEKTKKEIFDLVYENYDVILRACQEKDADALCDIEGITEVNIDQGYVLVYCKGAGIAPSSQDYGFYYSEEKLPVAVDCNQDILCDAEDLMPEGNGYQYIHSGNVFYTEQIKDNIYFYSAAY